MARHLDPQLGDPLGQREHELVAVVDADLHRIAPREHVGARDQFDFEAVLDLQRGGRRPFWSRGCQHETENQCPKREAPVDFPHHTHMKSFDLLGGGVLKVLKIK
jgi:hypothetical protein